MGSYHQICFYRGVREFAQLPPDGGREVAVAGRSNSGKSSAINALTQRKKLARTSKTPGRTQALNFFQIVGNHYLVDLPGYGYAKVAETLRHSWHVTMERYLRERQALQGLLLTMDIRHPLSALDQQLLDWCQDSQRQLSVHILLTKTDKLKRGPALTTLKQVQKSLDRYNGAVEVQLFSSSAGIGWEQARAKLDDWLQYR